jgi:hypothetical protein
MKDVDCQLTSLTPNTSFQRTVRAGLRAVRAAAELHSG